MEGKCVRCFTYEGDCVHKCPHFMIENSEIFVCEPKPVINEEKVTDSAFTVIIVFFSLLFIVISAKVVSGVYLINKYSYIK